MDLDDDTGARMNLTKRTKLRQILPIALIIALGSVPVLSQTDSGAAKPVPHAVVEERDGQHDFDFCSVIGRSITARRGRQTGPSPTRESGMYLTKGTVLPLFAENGAICDPFYQQCM